MQKVSVKCLIAQKEIHNLRKRWNDWNRQGGTGWENFDSFVSWCVNNGYQKGRELRKKYKGLPHGPKNSYFYDPNERTGVCRGCKQKCNQANVGKCPVWQAAWIKNWNENIYCGISVPEPEKPRKRECFQYEHPDLVRERICAN